MELINAYFSLVDEIKKTFQNEHEFTKNISEEELKKIMNY